MANEFSFWKSRLRSARAPVDMLGRVNCHVIGPAAGLVEALAFLVDSDVDAAILDVKIEGQSSTPVAEELIRRDIPWAFTSSNETDDLARRYPGVPIIAKPFTSEHVEAVLRALMEAR